MSLNTVDLFLEVLAGVNRIEPAHFVESSPELASLVDIDLACLLSISLPEFLSDAQCGQASLKYPSLAAQVGGAGQTKDGRDIDFRLVEHMTVWIVG